MLIYDDVKKNIKIAIYSKHNNILDKVIDELEKEEFKVEKYNDVDKLFHDISKKKIKILIYPLESKEELEKIENLNIKVILYNKKINIDTLKVEIYYNLKLIDKEEKIDFEKYKLEIVGNLVESISHKVQSNLLVLGASQDIIKMINSDLEENDERKDVLESLYEKNSYALEKANMLLQLVSNATTLSHESIMHCNDIKDIINVILDEYLKENEVLLSIEEKIKVGSYICGPLNDVIFVICRVIKLLIDENKKNIHLIIYEDEVNWYFSIDAHEKIIDSESIEQIRKFIVYIKNVRPKVNEKQISLIIKKIK